MMQILEKSGSYIFVLSTTIIRSFSERYNTYGWYVKYNLTLDILKIILLNDLSLRCLIHILLLHNTSCLCSQVPIRNSYIFCDKSCVLSDGTKCACHCHWNMKRTVVLQLTLNPRCFIFILSSRCHKIISRSW